MTSAFGAFDGFGYGIVSEAALPFKHFLGHYLHKTIERRNRYRSELGLEFPSHIEVKTTHEDRTKVAV